MAKKGVFFQLYLNPSHCEDREIITWLKTIPRSRRSQKVREILLGAIREKPRPDPEPVASGPRQEVSGTARNFLLSLPKRSPSGS